MKTREERYETLTLRFRPIAEKLDGHGKTDLDGILWVLAQEIEFDILEAMRREARIATDVIATGQSEESLREQEVETPNPYRCASRSLPGVSRPLELYPVDC